MRALECGGCWTPRRNPRRHILQELQARLIGRAIKRCCYEGARVAWPHVRLEEWPQFFRGIDRVIQLVPRCKRQPTFRAVQRPTTIGADADARPIGRRQPVFPPQAGGGSRSATQASRSSPEPPLWAERSSEDSTNLRMTRTALAAQKTMPRCDGSLAAIASRRIGRVGDGFVAASERCSLNLGRWASPWGDVARFAAREACWHGLRPSATAYANVRRRLHRFRIGFVRYDSINRTDTITHLPCFRTSSE